MRAGSRWRTVFRFCDTLSRHDVRQFGSRLWNRTFANYHARPLFHDRARDVGGVIGNGDAPPIFTPDQMAALAADLGRTAWQAARDRAARASAATNAGGDKQPLYNKQRFRLALAELVVPALLEDDSDHASLLVARQNAWLRGELPGIAFGMEPLNISLRLREWIWASVLLDGTRLFPPDRQAMLAESMHAQAARLVRHLEYETPGNHPILNLFALWLFEAVIRGKPAGWRSRWLKWHLTRELDRSFGNDGTHVELSSHYHLQMMRLLEEYRCWRLAVGDPPGQRFSSALQHRRRATFDLMPRMGPVPLIGDHCFSFFGLDQYEDLATLRAVEPDAYGPFPGAPTPDAVLLNHLAKASRPPPTSTPATDAPKRQNCVYLPEAGYLISHAGPGPQAGGYFLLDAGPLGYPANPGHGHADFLNVILQVGETPLLIDPGVEGYRDSKRCLWFKRARAHNTFFLDEQEAADLWRFFRWSDLPPRPQLDWGVTESGLWAQAVFAGHRRPVKVRHERRVDLDWTGEMQVQDKISGPVPCESGGGIGWHLHPAWKVHRVGDRTWQATCRQLRVGISCKHEGGTAGFSIATKPVARHYGAAEQGPVLTVEIEPGWRSFELTTRITWRDGT